MELLRLTIKHGAEPFSLRIIMLCFVLVNIQKVRQAMIIYKITNLKNKKIYIGQTKRTLEERMSEHCRKGINYIDRAIKKHGINSFKIEIIEECKNIDELNERERYWIKKLETKAPKGYNLTDGGEGTAGHIVSNETRRKMSELRKGRKFHPLSEEHRKKISLANKGRKRSAEYCQKFSERQRGCKRNPHSKETRLKMSLACKGKRAVRCIETGVIFESITAACKWADVTISTLITALRKNNHTAGGYHWEYADKT